MKQRMSFRKVFNRLAVAVFLAIGMIAIILGFSDSTQNAQENGRLSESADRFAYNDEITRDIRDGSKTFFRVNVENDDDRKMAARYGNIVEDYETFVIITTDRRTAANRWSLENQSIETSISLPASKFDPVRNVPTGTVRPDGGGSSGEGYYVVQFGGIATDEWLDSLRGMGVEILQYVPHNAFFVYASEQAILRAASHSRVRWAGAFSVEHKITDILRDQVSAARLRTLPRKGVSPLEMTGANTSVFDVAVFERADINKIADVVAASYGGQVRKVIDLPNNYFNVVRVELPLDSVLRVADIPDVITIDFYNTPQAEDERAAHIVSGNYTSSTVISVPGYDPLTQFGVDGTNVTVAVADDGISIPGNGGFYITSANTVHGVLRGASAGATGGHGHINASIIAGNTPFGILDPTGHNYGLGVAPKANIINSPFLVGGYTGSEMDVYNDTVITPGPNGVNGSISNNSWGNGTNSNVYDAYTAQFDGFVRDTSSAATIDPITLVYSAGNSGPGALSLTRPKTAKNIIATGNSENVRTELGGTSADNMDDLRSTSSRGPAADGRVKPDIVAPGTVITGSRAGTCGSVSSCFDANHAYSSGTSHAAPQIAGAAALFTQFWKNGNGGVNPSPALIKAAIISTAQEMNGLSTGTAIPNGNEGWGRINMKYMLNTGVPMKYVNQTTEFGAPGNSATFSGTVGDAARPIRVSLVWTDPPGAPNANPAMVNNLDLTVTIGANTYRGNVFAGGVSTTGGSSDTINNVENIFLPAGVAAGTNFSITVSATAINGDGVLGNADTTDQHFALVAYNFNDASPSAAISGTVTYGNPIGAPATRFVSNVQINGAGSPAVNTTTGGLGATEGQYSLTGFGAGAYTVTPTKTTGVNGSITSFDAARVAQHVIGSSVLNATQFVVADVSSNGSVTSFDAAQIAKYVASSPPFGAAGTWRFTPVNRNYASVTSSISGEDYFALLMGEVSGSWTNNGTRPHSNGPEKRIAVNIARGKTAAGGDVVVPIEVRGAANKGIISYEFDLRYDPSVLQPQGQPVDVAGTASRGLSYVLNAEQPGLLRVVMYGPLPIERDGLLLNLKFTVIGTAGSAAPLAIERVIFNESYIADIVGGQTEVF